jgi:hypothetical protein
MSFGLQMLYTYAYMWAWSFWPAFHCIFGQVESMDKAGNFIGYLWVNGTNLSVHLVTEGFATMHFTADRWGKPFSSHVFHISRRLHSWLYYP